MPLVMEEANKQNNGTFLQQSEQHSVQTTEALLYGKANYTAACKQNNSAFERQSEQHSVQTEQQFFCKEGELGDLYSFPRKSCIICYVSYITRRPLTHFNHIHNLK